MAHLTFTSSSDPGAQRGRRRRLSVGSPLTSSTSGGRINHSEALRVLRRNTEWNRDAIALYNISGAVWGMGGTDNYDGNFRQLWVHPVRVVRLFECCTRTHQMNGFQIAHAEHFQWVDGRSQMGGSDGTGCSVSTPTAH